MAKILSLPDDVSFDVPDGETLLEAALRSDVPMAHACGGRAKCSTCRVWVLDGLEGCHARSEPELALAERLQLGDEIRLACQLRPEGDLRLRRLVLDETDLMITSQFDRSAATRTGQSRDIVVFFSDVTGFTAISEALLPYDVMYLLNRYFAQAGQIVEANGGYVDKFVGDGMMAIFGIDESADAPLRSVNAALQTLHAVDRMKPFLSSMYGVDFDIRIGLHRGEAVIGSVGSPGNERLTAIGDVVNVASRVEAANKEAGTRLLITEAVQKQIHTQAEVADFVRVRLPGTSDRITLYEVARLTPEADAAVNAVEARENMRFAGKDWVRVCAADELADGDRRIFEFESCYVVVQRQGDVYLAFNNACPHLRLPFFDVQTGQAPAHSPAEEEVHPPPASTFTDDLGLVCRWHQSCFDLQTGEVREWCQDLDENGISAAMPHLGDLSKNQSRLDVFPCRVQDGHVWITFD